MTGVPSFELSVGANCIQIVPNLLVLSKMLTWQSSVEQAQSDYLTSLTDPFTIHLLFPIQTLIVIETQSSLPSSAAIISLMRSGGFQLEQKQSEMPIGEEDQNYERKSHSLEQWMVYKKKPREKMVKGRRGVQDMVPLC